MVNLPPQCNLVELETVGSTSDYAKNLAKNGYPSGTVVWAHRQTSGRGRHGNKWDSPSGNLFMSMLLRPDMNAALVGQMSFVVAVALAKMLEMTLLNGTKVELKWPNDILFNGRKAAGILMETELNGVQPVNWVVIGVGINVAVAPEGASSLVSCGVKGIALEEVLEKAVHEIMHQYHEWKVKGFAPVRQEWLKHAHNLGGTINVRLADKKFSGKFLGIDGTGALQIEMENGKEKTITAGEVFF